ncbi:hypothetical protein Prudu_009366 [Prunus dulcis]|uniref:DUF1985 domain-containing protein n=1 Tax=Prunus dulcis TaxID=3755 RepID=A0A4Y1R627_PRUDU|nr:hypothetical protein Prudu_009366 [Prunus dulcis]
MESDRFLSSGRVLGVLKLCFEPLNEEGLRTSSGLLRLSTACCSGKLIPRVSKLNGIKFIVGKKVIQFTAQQFCIVTGLRFGNLPFIPIPTNENCSLKRKYFANDKSVKLLELEKAFLECDDADDVFKLGFIYFAVFVLLGSEKHVHIDMRYLKLAEDLEDFGNYPWGAVCYAKTNASLLRALCADYQRIWAYEVFPALAALHLVVHEENAYIPRLLPWRSNSSPRFYELMSQVFENREVDVQLLRPSVMDKQAAVLDLG